MKFTTLILSLLMFLAFNSCNNDKKTMNDIMKKRDQQLMKDLEKSTNDYNKSINDYNKTIKEFNDKQKAKKKPQ